MEYAGFGHYALRFFLLIIISFSVVFGSFYIIGVAGFEAGADFWRAGASETAPPPTSVASQTSEPEPPSPVPSASLLVGAPSSSPTAAVPVSSPSATFIGSSPSPKSSVISSPHPSATPSPKFSITPSPSSSYSFYRVSPSFSPSPSLAGVVFKETAAPSPENDPCANQWFGARLINSLFNNCQDTATQSSSESKKGQAVVSQKSPSFYSGKTPPTRQQKTLLTKEEQREYKAQARMAGLTYATANLKKELIVSIILASLGTFFWWLVELGRIAV